MNIQYRNYNFVARRFTVVAMLLCFCTLMQFTAGCQSTEIRKNPLAEQVDTLRNDKRQLTRQIEQLESQNKNLKKQINALHGFADDIKIKEIYDVKRIKVTKYTNILDKDKNGTRETLIVYLQPIDQDGDIIKAAGTVDVRLLDLDKDKDPVLLRKWHLTPAQLRKLWFNALMKTHYRMTFDVSDKVENYDKPLTVTVTFTDYLSGKVFEEQRLIKPQ